MSKNNIGLRSGMLLCTLAFLMMSSPGRLPHIKANYYPLIGETLYCLITTDDTPGNKPYSVGYHYQVLSEFAKDQQCDLRLIPLSDSLFLWDAMIKRPLTVMIMNAVCDSVPKELEERFIVGPSLNTLDHAWVVLNEDFEVMQAMYAWFNSFKYTEQYAKITSRFSRHKKSRTSNSFTGELSPYDDLIKKYSREIGGDWRLLAALIHQESNFRMHVSSTKGAIGLMQVTKETAQKYGIDPELLYDPEQNIRAGSLMLKDLYKQLHDSLLVDEELTKFVLASYNAGPERIKDCRNFALSQGKNPNDWEEVASVFPLMSQKEHYESEHIKIGPFKGIETTAYVMEVLARYRHYSTLVH